jgi:hypothetical protein
VFHPEQSTDSPPRTTTSRSAISSNSRPALPSPPPSYNTAVGNTGGQGEKAGGFGFGEAGVMSGVGMAALYCAKLAYEFYCAPVEAKKEEEEKGS